MRPTECFCLIALCVIFGLLSTATQCAFAEKQTEMSDDLWSRTHRVFAYDAPRRARYPSIARNEAGDLIVLFTQVSEQQEAGGVGDVMMKVYEGKAGEPRTYGTLATLASGRLVATAAQMGAGPAPRAVHLLTSDDGGANWQASGPLAFPGVTWASPYGRLMEDEQGTLVMSVEAGLGADQGRKDKACVGLVRSSDGGQSWGDFSVIAADPAKSFTQPAVLAAGDNSLVAIVHRGERLYRCESKDGGYQWTIPQQVLLGREPQLVRITDQALACVSCRGDWWGFILVSFSYNDGKSWRCDRKVMEHPGEPGGHFGWPVALALDADHLITVFGHTQLPSSSMDAPAPRPIAEEEERIEVVFFERVPGGPDLHWAKKITPPESRDRWKRVEGRQLDIPPCFCRTAGGELIGITGGQSRIKVSAGDAPRIAVGGPGGPEELWRSSDGGRTWQKRPMNLPPGFRGRPALVTQLSSGRLLCAVEEWLLEEWNSTERKIIGQRGGYYIWDTALYNQTVYKTRVYVVYSDDKGQTWQGAHQPIDISPLDWACLDTEPFAEQADGTVILPVFGCLSEQDTRERLDCTGVFRSTDGGKTWGDFSLIASDQKRRWAAYNEMNIALVSDRLWVAFMRTEYRGVGNEFGWTSRAVSTDGGYTWSQPELFALGGAFGAAILPDGGIVLGHAAGGIHFTYDLGRTWSRLAPASGYAAPFLLDDDTLLVGDLGNDALWGNFGVWRRIPAGEGDAR